MEKYGKVIQVFQTTNQYMFPYLFLVVTVPQRTAQTSGGASGLIARQSRQQMSLETGNIDTAGSYWCVAQISRPGVPQIFVRLFFVSTDWCTQF